MIQPISRLTDAIKALLVLPISNSRVIAVGPVNPGLGLIPDE